MTNLKFKKLTTAALFAALTCVMTLSIRIPIPGISGFIHPGDAMVILCGAFLEPGTGFMAAGLGSCMADLLGGYLIYVPATFLLKGLTALLVSLMYRKAIHSAHFRQMAVIGGGIIDMIVVTGGYFLFESFIYGAGALTSVPANLIQGSGGLLIASLMYPVLSKIPSGIRSAA